MTFFFFFNILKVYAGYSMQMFQQHLLKKDPFALRRARVLSK